MLQSAIILAALCFSTALVFAQEESDLSEPNETPVTARVLLPGEEASFALTPRLDRDVSNGHTRGASILDELCFCTPDPLHGNGGGSSTTSIARVRYSPAWGPAIC